MILYHGSKRNLPIGESLLTSTGRDDGDILKGGAVFLTNTPDKCSRYDQVYDIEVSAYKSYKEALTEVGRVKKPRYTNGVFVARPSNTKILRKRR